MNAGSRTLLVALAVVAGWLWHVANQQPPTAAPAEAKSEFVVSGPYTHDNLSVFLLHGPDSARERPVLGLDEALAKRMAIVHETGNVGELAVENTSQEADLLLLSGDIVKGGKQDRVLQATAILPPNSGRVAVRSFCVEQSRWTGRKGQDASRFSENRGTIAGKDLKRAVQVAGSQGAVWQNVAAQQGALTRAVGETVNSPDSPTSLQLALEHDKVQAEVVKVRDAISRRVAGRTDVVGFVTVLNGQVTGAEAFGSHAIFAKAWAKAVTAAAVEAVAERTDEPFAAVTAGDVKSFLADAGRQGVDTVTSEVAPSPSPAATAERTQVLTPLVFEQPDETTELADNDQLGVIVIRGRSNEEIERMRRVIDSFVQTQSGGQPSQQPLDQVVDRVPLRVASRVLRTEADAPRPVEKNATVVEYREKGSGAVIHRSFLPK